jgi:hypothetical protein
VPVWVLESTGLGDSKQIIAKYGKGATFKKGQPVPARQESQPETGAAEVTPIAAAKTVKAKSPTVRKKKG